MNNFDLELKEKTKYVENIVYSYCPREEGMQKIIIEAINYSIKAGGKRLRPMLLLEMLKLFGGNEKDAYPFMAAIEMIHTYSLVHDDLPAMDNDEQTWKENYPRSVWRGYGNSGRGRFT